MLTPEQLKRLASVQDKLSIVCDELDGLASEMQVDDSNRVLLSDVLDKVYYEMARVARHCLRPPATTS
jgi:hypothetical protein